VNLSAGDYRTLKRFLSLIEHNRRIYDLRALSLGRDKKDYAIEMVTYYLDTNVPVASPAAVKP
jgi:hypothetical protein